MRRLWYAAAACDRPLWIRNVSTCNTPPPMDSRIGVHRRSIPHLRVLPQVTKSSPQSQRARHISRRMCLRHLRIRHQPMQRHEVGLIDLLRYILSALCCLIGCCTLAVSTCGPGHLYTLTTDIALNYMQDFQALSIAFISLTSILMFHDYLLKFSVNQCSGSCHSDLGHLSAFKTITMCEWRHATNTFTALFINSVVKWTPATRVKSVESPARVHICSKKLLGRMKGLNTRD